MIDKRRFQEQDDMMLEVGFVSRQRLTGKNNGSSAYLLDIAGAVRDAGMVPVLVQPSPSLMGRTPVVRISQEVDVFGRHHIRGVARFGSWLISLSPRCYLAAARGAISLLGRRLNLAGGWTRDRPLPYSVSIPWTAADHAFCRRRLASADLIFADYVFQTEVFDDADERSPTAVIMHDLFSARDVVTESGSGRDVVADMNATTEARLLGRATAVIAIQSTELQWVAQNVAGSTAILVPMAVRTVESSQPGGANKLLFVGSNTVPNIVGLQWFIDNVWPKIRHNVPDARLTVVGGVKRSFLSPIDGVNFVGIIESLEDVYADAAVVISPLLTGSGLKIKLIEALGFGKAVVATSMTVQGVEDQCAEIVLLADVADDFADNVISLLKDGDFRRNVAARSLTAARKYFSADACHRDLVDWLNKVMRLSPDLEQIR